MPQLSKKIIIAVTIILIIVNIYITTFFSFEERRLARLLGAISFIILFIVFKGYRKNKTIAGVLLMLLTSDILGFYFENQIISKLIYCVRIVSYIFLILAVFKKVKFEKVKPSVFFVISVVILLNLYLLYTLLESATRISNDILEYILILIYGITVVCTMFAASNYNLRYNNWRSTYYFYAVLAFILSDLSWFCAYFLKYSVLFNADIIFYYLGLFCIINYSVYTKDSEDKLLTEV